MSQPPPHAIDDARILWEFLRIKQDLVVADIILVLGGHDPSVGPHAASLFHRNLAPLIVVSGGSTHVPPSSDGGVASTEEDAIASYLEAEGVPSAAVILETRAANTSENFWFTADLLKSANISFASAILVTKPYQERRALATGNRRWPAIKLEVSGPEIEFDEYVRGPIPESRIFSMMAGEVQRIAKYSSEGFLDPQEIPENVRSACDRLIEAGYSARAI